MLDEHARRAAEIGEHAERREPRQPGMVMKPRSTRIGRSAPLQQPAELTQQVTGKISI